ncbi:MFS transporter [Thermosipho ferrireducens]|uniref:MFS transporter n=1 Tax=Thermosipho ferrireducens TaxID=2571116 RepID=A0ABX7SAA6_9BACT|nr:MFS transporter [Thermosipho ferrireducens]QTA38672.1 MFS transporter [Thermosipho ferrireducens]
MDISVNIRVYRLFKLFINLLIIGPILVPFMLYKGLSYFQILSLQTIARIAVIVFEIPTGTIADKISRKISIFFSGIFAAISILLYIFGWNFWTFAVAEVLFGIGATFYSGADSALLFESLKKMGKEKEFHTIQGGTDSLVFFSLGVGSIFSSMLYKINPYYPWWFSFGFVIFASFISLFFVEPEREKSEHKYSKHILESFNIVWSKKRVLWAICFAMFSGTFLGLSFWLYQPYFEFVDIDVFYYGAIFFGFNLIASFSSKFLVKKYKDRRPRRVLLVLSTLFAVSFTMPVILVSKVSILFFSLQQMFRGAASPFLKFYVNLEVEDKFRATVLSIASLAGSLAFAIFAPFFGKLLDNAGVRFTYITISVLSWVSVIGLYYLRKRQKRKLSIEI